MSRLPAHVRDGRARLQSATPMSMYTGVESLSGSVLRAQRDPLRDAVRSSQPRARQQLPLGTQLRAQTHQIVLLTWAMALVCTSAAIYLLRCGASSGTASSFLQMQALYRDAACLLTAGIPMSGSATGTAPSATSIDPAL